jgi:hypothetical protein
MNKPTRRRRTACRHAARTLAVATAIAAVIATLSAGQALAGPDERVLERQGRIDRQAEVGQADEQGKAVLPPQLSSEDKDAFAQAEREHSQQPAATTPRRYFQPEPPVYTGGPLDTAQQVPPAPAPPVPADSRTGLAVTLAVVALLLAVGAAATWRIHRRPRPEPTT